MLILISQTLKKNYFNLKNTKYNDLSVSQKNTLNFEEKIFKQKKK